MCLTHSLHELIISAANLLNTVASSSVALQLESYINVPILFRQVVCAKSSSLKINDTS